jgi:hypothetical protein
LRAAFPVGFSRNPSLCEARNCGRLGDAGNGREPRGNFGRIIVIVIILLFLLLLIINSIYHDGTHMDDIY